MFEVKVTKVDLSDQRKRKVLLKRILEDYELAMDLIDQLEDRYDSSCHSVEFTDLASYGRRQEWSI